jgi:hypothetical protein
MSLLVAAVMMVASSASADTSFGWTAYIGEPGGDAFNFSCGSVPLTSMNVRSGSTPNGVRVIDAVKGVCWNGSVSPWYGGTNGSSYWLQCPYDHAIRGLNSYGGWYVNGLQAFCEEMGGTHTATTGWVGSKSGTYKALRCSGGQAAKAIRGGAGVFVDRLAIYCNFY